MRRWRCIVFLFSMLMLYTVSCAGKTDWHLERNKEGVKVYTRAVSNSSINELRAEMTVHANLNSIMALLRDVPAFKEWVYHCKESHELKRNGNEVYYYQYTSVPFPISDRDLIIHSNWHQSYLYCRGRSSKLCSSKKRRGTHRKIQKQLEPDPQREWRCIYRI